MVKSGDFDFLNQRGNFKDQTFRSMVLFEARGDF